MDRGNRLISQSPIIARFGGIGSNVKSSLPCEMFFLQNLIQRQAKRKYGYITESTHYSFRRNFEALRRVTTTRNEWKYKCGWDTEQICRSSNPVYNLLSRLIQQFYWIVLKRASKAIDRNCKISFRSYLQRRKNVQNSFKLLLSASCLLHS